MSARQEGPAGIFFFRPVGRVRGLRGSFQKLRMCCVILGSPYPSLSLLFLVRSLEQLDVGEALPQPLLVPITVLSIIPPLAGLATWLLSFTLQCLAHSRCSAKLC